MSKRNKLDRVPEGSSKQENLPGSPNQLENQNPIPLPVIPRYHVPQMTPSRIELHATPR